MVPDATCHVPFPDPSDMRTRPDAAPVGIANPVIRAVPATSSFDDGAVVPTPRFPPTYAASGVYDPQRLPDSSRYPSAPHGEPSYSAPRTPPVRVKSL